MLESSAKHPARHALVAAVVWLVLMVTACTQQDEFSSQRFLYVVNCNGSVDKLDTHERKKVLTIQLSERSGSPPAVPKLGPTDKYDGCMAQHVVVDADRKWVRLVAPKAARVNSQGAQDFQLLTFSLPEWTLTEALPVGKFVEAPYVLRGSAKEQTLTVPDDARTRFEQRDMAAYHDSFDFIAFNSIIGSSGTVTLLAAHVGDPSRTFYGLADLRTHKVTRITDVPDVPPTHPSHVRLAPGGGFVLVEITNPPGSSDIRRTGGLRLYDAQGKRVADWMDERIRDMQFVALTANGMAIYSLGYEYHFIALDQRFGTDASTVPRPGYSPGLVFSAQ